MPVGGQIGYGVVITFSSSLFAMITSVKWSGMKRAAVNVSYSAMTDSWEAFIPKKLVDAGELDVELLFDNEMGLIAAITAAPATVTVAWPLPQSGGTTKGTWACSGFLTDLEATAPIDDKMVATAKLKFTGIPTLTNHS